LSLKLWGWQNEQLQMLHRAEASALEAQLHPLPKEGSGVVRQRTLSRRSRMNKEEMQLQRMRTNSLRLQVSGLRRKARRITGLLLIYTEDNSPEASRPSASITVQQAPMTKSPGGYSGTTARTSGTPIQGQSRLPVEKMVDNLAQLDDAASRMVDLLTPVENSLEALEKVTRNFRETTRSAGRALLAKRDQLHGARRTYTRDPYFNVQKTVQALIAQNGNQELSDGPWRPDDIFYKANLAVAAEDIQLCVSKNGTFHLPLEKLQHDFPDRFLHRVAPKQYKLPRRGTSFLLKETFELGLAIRVQYAVFVLASGQYDTQHSPEDILRDIFMGDGLGRGWDVQGLQSDDLSAGNRKKIVTYMDTVQTAIRKLSERQDRGEDVDLQELHNTFPAAEFVQEYLAWIRARTLEIDAYLASVGKVVSIQERIEELFEQLREGELPQAGSARSYQSRLSGAGSENLTPAKRIALSRTVSS
jgi:hypothetical protein